MNSRSILTWVAVVVVAFAAACGGGSPSSPSSASGVAVQGVVTGGGTAVAAASGAQAAAGPGKVTVKVEGTTITAEVGANGTFELKGIPSGTFTLVFLVDGVEIGRVVVNAAEGAEVKITVQIQNSTLVVIEIRVEGGETPGGPTTPATCIIDGGTVGQGIQLEGNVSSGNSGAFKLAVNGARAGGLVDVSASSASFRCIGGAKAPTDAECKASLKAGAMVHVSGALLACSTMAAQVTATEVKVQKN